MLFDQLRFQSDSCFSSLWYDFSWIYDFLPLFCAAQTGSRFQNCGAQAVKNVTISGRMQRKRGKRQSIARMWKGCSAVKRAEKKVDEREENIEQRTPEAKCA